MRDHDEPADGLPPERHGDPDESFDEGPVELIRPEDFLGPSGIPADARRLGLDRNTQEGALVALAGSLDPGKLSHRAVAWVLLVVFLVPLLLGVARPWL